MTRGYGTPELCYKYTYTHSITRQVVFCSPAQKMSSLFSPVHVSSQCLTAALMAFQLLKMG